MVNLFKPTSYQKGTWLSVGAALACKPISALNALLMAAYFGATYQTDIYFYLLLLIGLGTIFLQRLNTAVLIPEAMFLQHEQEHTARRFLNMWLYLYGILALGISLLACYYPVAIAKALSRFDMTILAQNHWLLTCGFWVCALQILNNYLTCIAEMYKFFKIAWLGVLYALFPLFLLLFLGRKIGIISLIYGMLAAQTLQLFILLGLLKIQLHWSFAPAWFWPRTRTRQNMAASQTLAVVDITLNLLPNYLISGMGIGLISALNYCRQFTDSAMEVFISRTVNVVKIQMTEQTAHKDLSALNHTFMHATQALTVLLAALTIFSCYFATDIVDLFFKRGNFTQQTAQNTVYFLRPMLFLLLLYIPGNLQNSAIAAACKIKEWFPYALLSCTISALLTLWILPRWGAFSYPYVLILSSLIGYIINAFLFKKHFAYLQYIQPFWHVLRISLLAGLALAPAALLSHVLPANCWVQVFGCGPVFVAIYIGILYFTKDLQGFLKFIR